MEQTEILLEILELTIWDHIEKISAIMFRSSFILKNSFINVLLYVINQRNVGYILKVVLIWLQNNVCTDIYPQVELETTKNYISTPLVL